MKAIKRNAVFCVFSNLCTAITLYLPLFTLLLAFLVLNLPFGEQFARKASSEGLIDQNNDVFHFVHISDIHLSNLVHNVYERFDTFLGRTIPMIQPAFVIQSGDITHAKETNAFPPQSDQQIHEWKKYRELLEKNGLFDDKFWIDLRGNHDNMGVRSLSDSSNYFHTYGVMGRTLANSSSDRVYSYSHVSPGGKLYSFLFMDTSEAPGLNYPVDVFPFISFKSANIENELKQKLNELKNSQQIFLVGHYPISSFYSPSEFFNILDCVPDAKVSTYLTGHYHMKHMYNRFYKSLLELEVADFKHKSMYRIMAVDNGATSFVDTDIENRNPIVLITNPKNSKYLTNYDQWETTAQSSHVRVLVFSESPITTVQLLIDNEEPVLMEKSLSNDKLYTHTWQAAKYADGKLHTIRVIARDESSKEGQAHHEFSLTGRAKSASVNLFMNYFQRANHSKLIMILFLVPYLYGVVVLLLIPKAAYLMFRYKEDAFKALEENLKDFMVRVHDGMDESEFIRMNDNEAENDAESQKSIWSVVRAKLAVIGTITTHSMYMHMWRYMHIPLLSWLILVFHAANILVAPLFIAPVLMKKYWGFYFLWGVFVDGNFLPKRGDSFGAGLLITVLIWLPCVVLSSVPYNAQTLYYQCNPSFSSPSSDDTATKRILKKMLHAIRCLSVGGVLLVILVALASLYGLFFMTKLYGIKCLFASLWTVLLAMASIFSVVWSFATHIRNK